MTQEQPKNMEYYLQACSMTNAANEPVNNDTLINTQNQMPVSGDSHNRQPGRFRNALVVGAAVLATAVGVYGCARDNDEGVYTGDGSEQVTPVNGGVTDAMCEGTWAVHELDNTGHRIISTGIESIRTASTPDEARQAAYDFVEITKTDPDVVAANAKAFLGEDVDAASLQANGCMTEDAEQLVLRTAIAIGDSEVTPDQAPANGINSGVNGEGTVVEAHAAGISGDRKAIKIVLKDGTTFWIMHRCGNYVTQNGQVFIKGPTDEQPNTPESTVPGSTLLPKYDDGRLPGNPNVPADQDKGTPDIPGIGDAGQQPGLDGYLPQETRPQAPSTAPDQTQAPTTTGRPTASTTLASTSTNPPVTATTSVSTTAPQGGGRPTQP